MEAIVNNAAIYCTETMGAFELINWRPCNHITKSLFDIENQRPLEMVQSLTIYDSEWTSILMQQISRLFPNLRRLAFFRCNFQEKTLYPADIQSLQHLKHLQIQCYQSKNKCLQGNMIAILKAYSNTLEHLTLSLDAKINFWTAISKNLRNLPSLQLAYIPKEIVEHVGRSLKFDHIKKLHLTIAPNVERIITLEFGQLIECTLDGCLDNMLDNDAWLNFIIKHQTLEKLQLGNSNGLGVKHLVKMFEKLRHLKELTMAKCSISVSNIVKILFISPSLRKLRLIEATAARPKNTIDSSPWKITYDSTNNISIEI